MPSAPSIIAIIERALEQGEFDAGPVEAMAALLWLTENEAVFPRTNEAVAMIKTFWKARSDDEDAYWAFLSGHDICAECGERYRIENLSVCPNCFNLYCPREARACDCGSVRLG
jgi:hypothetical protein